MKKLLTFLLSTVLGLACCFTFVGCGGGDDVDMSELQKKINEAQGLTTEQLVEKAKGETGNFVAYGTSSRITQAMTDFVAKYGSRIGLSSSNASGVKKNDSEIYELLMNEAEASNKSQAASMVLLQDSATMSQYISRTEILANYIPNGMEKFVDEQFRVPLAHQFINKLFMYNKLGTNNKMKFTNVWEPTDSRYNGRIYFKSPKEEQVNMNFLIMLTSPEWSAKLETAYKQLHDGAAATDVGSGKTYTNYGYKWIAEFLNNCDFSITSDTTIARSLSADTNANKMGLFVLSKLRDDAVTQANLQVSAWEKKSGSETEFESITPFAGFMYAIYAQLATAGPRPYTAMLFINYLMTDEGFTPWKQIGGYSANNSVALADKDDQPLSFWNKTLVVEDGAYIKTVKVSATDWINNKLPS